MSESRKLRYCNVFDTFSRWPLLDLLMNRQEREQISEIPAPDKFISNYNLGTLLQFETNAIQSNCCCELMSTLSAFGEI